MGNGLSGRLSYSNVVATLALFLALGGGIAVAASLTKNSVKSKHIKNGQVKTADIRAGAVKAAQLGSGAVTAAKLGDGAVTSPKLGNGSVTGAKLSADAVAAPVTLADLPNTISGGCALPIGDSWADQSPDVNEEAGWIAEPTGIVHLQGVVRRCNAAGETIFTLPEGARPARRVHLATMYEDGTVEEVTVFTSGIIVVAGAQTNVGLFLDGLSFRAG